jgi:predicted dehydrogenase
VDGKLRIGFIGAGAVNFGGGEGPWDHASRLEKIEGLEVVGIADPNVARAREKLAERSHEMYGKAEIFSDYREMLEGAGPDAVWIGVPPSAHGVEDAGMDIEIQCAAAGVHMFVEKPLSAFRPERVAPVVEAIARSGVVAGVGYMFRYSRAVDEMRRILAEAGGIPRAFSGRYNCAYSGIRKAEWWDVRMTGGLIVEQATHFADLARFLLGEVDLDSVKGVAIGGAEPLGRLEDVPLKEDGGRFDEAVDPAHRHACATAAVWKYAGGAVGSLVHGTLLHGGRYESELEVWADGLRLILVDPYGDCRLLVRRPHSEETETIRFAGDDPYLAEDVAFVEALRSGDQSKIRSRYQDAFETHRLAWAITDAAAE